jgi:hypothetical protein
VSFMCIEYGETYTFLTIFVSLLYFLSLCRSDVLNVIKRTFLTWLLNYGSPTFHPPGHVRVAVCNLNHVNINICYVTTPSDPYYSLLIWMYLSLKYV